MYVPNWIIQNDLKMVSVGDEIKNHCQKYQNRLNTRPNELCEIFFELCLFTNLPVQNILTIFLRYNAYSEHFLRPHCKQSLYGEVNLIFNTLIQHFFLNCQFFDENECFKEGEMVNINVWIWLYYG